MKSYPSISSKVSPGEHVWAFVKVDGSQIRAEWSAKKGFYKLGSRRQLIDSQNLLGQAQACLDRDFAEPLATIFKAKRWQRVVCFFELGGLYSFAGSHKPGDELDLTLFDVAPDDRGLLPPKEFAKLFKDLMVPQLVYSGPADEVFIESIRESTLLVEGVVCKTRKGHMFKVKTHAWIERVKELHGHDPAKLKELL